MAEAWGSGGRDSKYDIHAEIGSGGMATVHLGRLVGAGGFARTVAIKVLHATYAKNKEFVERFLDEARLVGRIHHPNVMPTLDVISEGDNLRIVMDYVAGESLDQLEAQLKAKGERVPMRVACAIVAGVLHGLHAAHEAKNEFGEPLDIVHLDVSPHNVLVGADGTSRLLDFGVARARGPGAGAAVSAGGGGGKSAYLAPEQVRGAEVSPRTDVFAASVVLWEMLTGESLFAADNHAATMQRVLTCVISAPSEKVDGIPPRLDELLKIGLRRDPAQRFATARDMALELEQAVLPALASEVGTWVESVARETLATRAAKVQAMEAISANRKSGQMPGLVSTREMYGKEELETLPSDLLVDANTDSLLRPAGRPHDLVPQRAADGSVRWQSPRPAVAPTQRSAVPVTAPMQAVPDERPNAEPLAIAAAVRNARAPLASVPSLPSSPARGRNWRMLLGIALGGIILGLGVVAAVVRAVVWPNYVKGLVIAAAAGKGVTLTVADASVSGDGVLLGGLTVRLASVPAITCTVASADVRTAEVAQPRAILGKTEITIDGDVDSVLASLNAWSASRHAGGPGSEMMNGQIVMPVAHLVWTHPSGSTASPAITRIEANGFQGTFGGPTSVSLDDDVHFLTDSLVLETRLGTFGPWNLDLDATPKRTRARLALDPAVPDGANALLVFDTAGDSSIDITVPHLPMSGLGIPRTAVGPDLPFPQQMELSLHYGRLRKEQTSASVRGSFFGVRMAELGAPVTATVSGDATGLADGSMAVRNGVFSLGAIRAAVTGSLTPHPGGLKAALEWKAEPVACASLGALPSAGAAARDLTHKVATGDMNDLGQLARDFGAIGEAVGVVKVTGNFSASGTVIGDTSDPSHAKFTTTSKNACGIALFQGK